MQSWSIWMHSGLKHSDWRAASQIQVPPAQLRANRAAYRPRLGVVPAVGRGGSKFFSLHSAWRGKLLFVHSNVELWSHFLLTPTVSLRWVWTSRTSFASLLTWWLLPFSPASSRHIQRLILIEPIAVLHATSCKYGDGFTRWRVIVLMCTCALPSFNFRAPCWKRTKFCCYLRTRVPCRDAHTWGSVFMTHCPHCGPQVPPTPPALCNSLKHYSLLLSKVTSLILKKKQTQTRGKWAFKCLPLHPRITSVHWEQATWASLLINNSPNSAGSLCFSF